MLNCYKLQIVFKSPRKLANFFRFKDHLPFDIVSGVVYKYTCGRCNSSHYGETDRHLKVRFREHIGISPLTFRKVKPSKESGIRDRLLVCNNIPLFDEFSILTWDIINIFLKSRKACLLSVIDLFKCKAVP